MKDTFNYRRAVLDLWPWAICEKRKPDKSGEIRYFVLAGPGLPVYTNLMSCLRTKQYLAWKDAYLALKGQRAFYNIREFSNSLN